MVGTLFAAGNGRITLRDVYEMVTIPSKYSWNYKIQPADCSALYLTNVEYLPGAFTKGQDENSVKSDLTNDDEDNECEESELRRTEL